MSPARSWPPLDTLRRGSAFACLDFVNSEWTDWRGQGPPTDRIDSREWWRRFFANWGFGATGLTAPSGARLRELEHLRALMRAAIEKGRMPSASEVMWLNRRLADAPQRWLLAGGRTRVDSRLVPARVTWAAVTAALILSFGELLNDAERSRLRRCANPDCSYLFYDESDNRSRRWCFTNVCGNLMHVRAFRAKSSTA